MTVNVYNMTDTWTASGTVYDAIKMDVTNTASAAGSSLLNLLVSGTSKIIGDKNGRLSALSFGLASSDAASPDAILARDAANTFAQRNGVSAQTWNIYNTYTDGSNYERGFARWSSNIFTIGAEGLGTGNPDRTVRISVYSTIDFWNSQYGYSMGNITSGYMDMSSQFRVPGASAINGYGVTAGKDFKIGFRVSDNNVTPGPELFWSIGTGSPESVVTAPIGSLYSRTDGSTSTTLYVKTSGTGNTGWTAK